MANFFLIDQSLKGLGGHHFDYSKLVTQAAADAGQDVVVGCHTRFRTQSAFPHSEVRNCFRFTTYASCSNLVGIQDMVARRKRNRLWHSLTSWFRPSTSEESRLEAEQARRIQAFREDCHKFFTKPLRKDDVVFFTTLSDLEAEGLFQFVKDRPDAKWAHWHLQFHFPVFRGRTPDYPATNPGQEFLKSTLGKLNALLDSNIHFYVTSENLKDQYDRLGLGFENLAYPVNSQLRVSSSSDSDPSRDTRLTFAGSIRHEKGGSQIENLVEEIESEFGHSVRLCLQRKKPSGLTRIKSLFRAQTPTPAHVELHPYPLGAEEYQAYIQKSDIGLLTTYDSETYFSRRAGILGEYLTAGVPVIVPGGSWLSDQIEKPQQAYLGQMIQDSNHQPLVVRPQSVSHHSDGSTTALLNLENSLKRTANSHHMLVVGLNVIRPSEHGNYIRVRLSTGAEGSTGIVGVDREHKQLLVPFYVGSDSGQVQLDLAPAFGAVPWQVADIQATILSSDRELPRSVVGMVAADWKQTTPLVAEMIRQYDHYKKSSIDFAEGWFASHDPQQTVSTLLNHSCPQSFGQDPSTKEKAA